RESNKKKNAASNPARRFTHNTTKDGLTNNSIRSFMEDADGNIWVGTWKGLNFFDGGTKLPITSRNGLAQNFIYALLQDREGNIWVGTNGGVSCIKSMDITTISQIDGLSDTSVWAMLQDKKGAYWIGTQNGLNRYSAGSFKTYTTADGLVSDSINTLLEDKQGNLWVGTINGINVLTPAGVRTYTMKNGLPSNIVFHITNDRRGVIWVASRKGVSRFTDGTFSTFPLKSTSGVVLFIMADTGGNMWFAERERLYRWAGTGTTVYTTRDGLPSGTNYLFEDSKARVWVCGNGGFSRFREGRFTPYLSGRNCKFVIEDKHGILWIGTENGLVRYDGNIFSTYTSKRHGLNSDFWLSGMSDPGGTLWFGSSKGITCLPPRPLKVNTVPPPIHISGVTVLGKTTPLSHIRQLTYRQNYIGITFDGLCYSAPESVRYMYRMEGIDSQWQETATPSIFYYLKPGTYRFHVKAVNNDGVESPAAAELGFRISHPFWQTWWFMLLVLLLLMGLSGTLNSWRYRQARDKAQLKSRTRQLLMAQRMELMGTLAAGTVHDLKNLLSIIMGYSQVITTTFKKDDSNHKNLDIIKETTATAIRMAKQILAFSRLKQELPGEVNLVFLLQEILDTLEISRPRSVVLERLLPSEPVGISIQPDRFRQVVMNLCLNAVQAMPRGGTLTVSLKKETSGEILLVVADTGVGIEPEMQKKIFEPLVTTRKEDGGTGLGLFVVKQIVEEGGGTIELHSEPGKGSSFELRFPPGG
ncbi:MAG: hypothetical protein GY765_26905, partial [bacterium]|nr:hypothetical protein [bacterium]